jgi:hypothetical protein
MDWCRLGGVGLSLLTAEELDFYPTKMLGTRITTC